MKTTPRVMVLMGVAGCGKSTIGKALAEALDCPFIEGDDFHSTEARSKMATGTPLDDADRWPWLSRLSQEIKGVSHANSQIVLSCSALKKAYRDFLVEQTKAPITFVYLQLTQDQASKRLSRRTGHFMPANLIESQFEILEPPVSDEQALTIDASKQPASIIKTILSAPTIHQSR